MSALPAALASLLLAAAPAAEGALDVGWIVGPASVELGQGRVRCAVPKGVALAAGAAARSILDVVAHGASGEELAVLSPVAPAQTWFVVVEWGSRAEGGPPADESGRAPPRVWLERPRRDERTGRVSWALAGAASGGPSVNRHLVIPAADGAVEVTLVTPLEELSVARAQYERIVERIEVTLQAPAGRR